MQIYYLIPVVLIAAIYYFTQVASKKIIANAQNMTPEEAEKSVNAYYGDNFELNAEESLKSVFVGMEYQGDSETAGQVAGAALNAISKATIGVSKYTPTVQVAITSEGRVLIAREYSEAGERGYYKQICTFPRGTRALGAETVRPGEQLTPPLEAKQQNATPPVFVRIEAGPEEYYDAWMSSGATEDSNFFTMFEKIQAAV